MAEVLSLRALRYDPAAVGSLEAVIAPPYDVIDAELRAELLERSDRNVVEVDLPETNDGDPYEHAAATLDAWKQDGTLVTDSEPAFWVLQQDYTAPDGTRRTRRGFFARVRVEEYGAGRIRPHERTHPGPKEDRLRLTRATKANLSPIFSLFADPDQRGQRLIEEATETTPFNAVEDRDGTTNTLWRVDDALTIEALEEALAAQELLIADGHHRYETARVYAEEQGDGPASHVLMFLCSLADPGLLVFPTHRLLTGLEDRTDKQQALRTAILENFDAQPLDDPRGLEPTTQDAQVRLGYLDSFHKQPYALTLKDQSIADAALQGKPEPYRRLDTAVLEALILKGALGMSEDDISHLHGLAYSKDFDDALDAVQTGRADAGFFMRATPVEQVQEVAAAGESMPPKSTYFFPKVPTGLVFNELR